MSIGTAGRQAGNQVSVFRLASGTRSQFRTTLHHSAERCTTPLHFKAARGRYTSASI